MTAAYNGFEDIVRMLLDRGADPLAKNDVSFILLVSCYIICMFICALSDNHTLEFDNKVMLVLFNFRFDRLVKPLQVLLLVIQ